MVTNLPGDPTAEPNTWKADEFDPWAAAVRDKVPDTAHYYPKTNADLDASLAAATSAGGGRIVLEGTTIPRTTGLSVGYNVSLIGVPGKTVLEATAAMESMISVAGVADDLAGNRNGIIEGIAVDGNDLADRGFYLGLSVQRQYRQNLATNCLEAGWVVNGGQNNLFLGCDAETNGASSNPNGGGLRLNGGCGGNTFIRCEFNENRGHNLIIMQDDTIDPALDAAVVAILYATPRNNTFESCLFERVPASGTMLSSVCQRAGFGHVFKACTFQTEGSRICFESNNADGTGESQFAIFTDFCQFSAEAGASIAFSLTGGHYPLLIAGPILAQGFLTLFQLDDTCLVDVRGYLATGSVTNMWDGTGTNGIHQQISFSQQQVTLPQSFGAPGSPDVIPIWGNVRYDGQNNRLYVYDSTGTWRYKSIDNT